MAGRIFRGKIVGGLWPTSVEATDIVRCHVQKSTYSLPERVIFRLRGFQNNAEFLMKNYCGVCAKRP